MATVTYSYKPNYAVPPGQVLEEHLEAREMSHAEFARRCGRSAKLISDIISGKAPVEPRTALQFEKVLGMDASVWLGIESDYQLHQAREAEKQKAAEWLAWSRKFPLNELIKRKVVKEPASPTEGVAALLAFFGVASVDSWERNYAKTQVAYRHSPSFKSDKFALATWLRLGELESGQIECAAYNESTFKKTLHHIRKLTAVQSVEVLSEAEELCAQSGVALAIVRPLPKTALSGAARWLTSQKALIQLSARHLRDDQLWFSFFHEAAHIVLHGKKLVFVHEGNGQTTVEDAEANQWAAHFLVPHSNWARFVASSEFSPHAVLRFAREQGIAPGIVVGRLQHEKKIHWSHLNDLRLRLEWKADVSG